MIDSLEIHSEKPKTPKIGTKERSRGAGDVREVRGGTLTQGRVAQAADPADGEETLTQSRNGC